jgi:hypothetical protein
MCAVQVAVACAFGIDGATVNLHGGPNGDGCPDAWCDPANPKPNANGYCAFSGSPPQAAWRGADLATLLTLCTPGSRLTQCLHSRLPTRTPLIECSH